MTPGEFLVATVKNFKPDKSILAGGGASLLVFLAGCALVSAGVVVPPITIFGIHLIAVATPITMTMVAGAAPVIGNLVSSYVSPTEKQAIDQFAKKMQTNIENVKAIVPVLKEEYPAGKNGLSESDNPPPSPNNLSGG